MRRMRRVMCAAIALALCVSPLRAFAVTTGELVAFTAGQDGSRVTIEGEAVGEAIRAQPGHRWINVLEGGTAVGVVVTEAMASRVERYGDHAAIGDRVRVTGVFHLACDEHGGDLDVHAEAFEVLEAGHPRSTPVALWKLSVIGACAPAIAVLFRVYRRRRSVVEV